MTSFETLSRSRSLSRSSCSLRRMTQAPVSLSGIYCALEGASVVHALQSSEDRGLDDNEATQRLSEMGHNAIPSKAPDSFLSKLWDQINNPLIFLLLGSAGLSLLLGHVDDAVSIALAVLIVSTGDIDRVNA